MKKSAMILAAGALALSGAQGFKLRAGADPECSTRKAADRGNEVWCLCNEQKMKIANEASCTENDNTDPNLKRENLCEWVTDKCMPKGQKALRTGDIPSAKALDATIDDNHVSQVMTKVDPPLPAKPDCPGNEPCDFKPEENTDERTEATKDGGIGAVMRWDGHKGQKDGETQIRGSSDSHGLTIIAGKLEELGKSLDEKFILLHAQHKANQAAMEEMVKNERKFSDATYQQRVTLTRTVTANIANIERQAAKMKSDAAAIRLCISNAEAAFKKAKEDTVSRIATLKTETEGKKTQVEGIITEWRSKPTDEQCTPKPDDTTECAAARQTSKRTRDTMVEQLSLTVASYDNVVTKCGTWTTDLTALADQWKTRMDALDKAATEALTLNDEYATIIAAAVTAIESEEMAMFKRFNDNAASRGETAQGSASDNPNEKGAATGGEGGEGETDVFLEVTARTKLSLYNAKEGSTHVIADAMRHVMMTKVNPAHSASVNQELINAKTALMGLISQVQGLDTTQDKEKLAGPKGAASLDLTQLDTAVQSVDQLATRMKAALLCLKQYLTYYQTGAAQTATATGEDHRKVTMIIKTEATKVGAQAAKIFNTYQNIHHTVLQLKTDVSALEKSRTNMMVEVSTTTQKLQSCEAVMQEAEAMQAQIDMTKLGKCDEAPTPPAPKEMEFDIFAGIDAEIMNLDVNAALEDFNPLLSVPEKLGEESQTGERDARTMEEDTGSLPA